MVHCPPTAPSVLCPHQALNWQKLEIACGGGVGLWKLQKSGCQPGRPQPGRAHPSLEPKGLARPAALTRSDWAEPAAGGPVGPGTTPAAAARVERAGVSPQAPSPGEPRNCSRQASTARSGPSGGGPREDTGPRAKRTLAAVFLPLGLFAGPPKCISSCNPQTSPGECRLLLSPL